MQEATLTNNRLYAIPDAYNAGKDKKKFHIDETWCVQNGPVPPNPALNTGIEGITTTSKLPIKK